MTRPKSPVIRTLYRDRCIDGYTSQFVVESHYRVNYLDADYLSLPYQYDWELNNALVFARGADILYIVDFSFSLENLYHLAKLVRRVVMLDHHKTSFIAITSQPPEEHPNEFFMEHIKEDGVDITIVLDNKISGALLTWQYLTKGDISMAPMLLRYVSDYDLYKFQYGDETKAIHKVLKITPENYEAWKDVLIKCNGSMLTDLLDKGEAINTYHEYAVSTAMEHAKRIQIGTYPKLGVALNIQPEFADHAGNMLSRYYKTFGVTFVIAGPKLYVSLRSQKNSGIDVSEIARLMGGGGHNNAAGFICRSNQLVWDDTATMYFIRRR